MELLQDLHHSTGTNPYTHSSETTTLPTITHEPKQMHHLYAADTTTDTTSAPNNSGPTSIIAQKPKQMHYLSASSTSTYTTSTPITIGPTATYDHVRYYATMTKFLLEPNQEKLHFKKEHINLHHIHTGDSRSDEPSRFPYSLPYDMQLEDHIIVPISEPSESLSANQSRLP